MTAMKTQRFTRDDISTNLIAAITTTLRLSGRPAPQLSEGLKIIKGIDGFDSQCGVEVTVDLEQLLDIDLGDNIFIGQKNGKDYARTFNQVVSAIWAILEH